METDTKWLDREYNPLLSIVDATALFTDWMARSEMARVENECHVDLAYGPSRGQKMDLFSPAGDGKPVFVFIHGGYWRGSDKAAHSFLAPPLVAQGAVVALLNYDLCPLVSIETIYEQVTAAVIWIYKNIHRYGGNRSRIVLGGHSAGAHLAAMLLLQDWKEHGAGLPDDLVTRALCISGLFDLQPLRLAPFLRDDIRLDEASAYKLSPANFSPRPGRRVAAAVGALESSAFHQQTALLQTQWGDEAVAWVDSIPGRNHFDVLNDLAQPGTLLHQRACELLFG